MIIYILRRKRTGPRMAGWLRESCSTCVFIKVEHSLSVMRRSLRRFGLQLELYVCGDAVCGCAFKRRF
jgi:hypothetical protein